MNKRFLVYFILVLFTLALVIVSTLDEVAAADVLYLVDNAGNLDNSEIAVKNFLIAEGYSVDVLDSGFNIDDYLLVVVGESVDSINFDNKDYRTLFMSRSAAKDIGIVSSVGLSSTRDITVNRIDDITQDYSMGDLRVYDDQSTIHYIKSPFPSNSINLAFKSNSYKSVLLALKINSLYQERNVYFGMIKSEKWNNDGKNLFRKSIDWLLASGDICADNDEDGFDDCDIGEPADDGKAVDCDDNDASFFPGNPDDLQKDCINNAPNIDSFNPNLDNPRVLENTDKEFSIAISDVDNDLNDLTISWNLDGNFVGTGGIYVFNKPSGSYELRVVVSDGDLEVEQVWNVTVGSIGDFTCNQVGGNICSENQVCEGSILGVTDTSNCCSIACVERPPEFTSIRNQCENKNSNIKINFEDISNNEEFNIDDIINSRLKITNDLDKKLDFDIAEYFYDVTKNKVIERKKDNFDINKDKFKVKDFEFFVKEDLEENNIYAFFVVAESEDGECNQKYVNIDIKRKEHRVILEDFEIIGDSFVCGDSVIANIDIKNIGTEDQDAALKLKNNKLKINEEINQIEIEKYGGDDSVAKDITFTIPDDAEAGDYTLSAEIYYNGNDMNKLEKTITLQECKKPVVDEEQIDNIKLLGKVSEVGDDSSKKPWYKMVSLYLLVIVIIGVLVFLGYYYREFLYFDKLISKFFNR